MSSIAHKSMNLRDAMRERFVRPFMHLRGSSYRLDRYEVFIPRQLTLPDRDSDLPHAALILLEVCVVV